MAREVITSLLYGGFILAGIGGVAMVVGAGFATGAYLAIESFRPPQQYDGGRP